MTFSRFGRKFTQDAGILELMDDLGKALETPGDKVMLGGGNPAPIPEMNRRWKARLAELAARDDEVEALVAQYDAPGGRQAFKASMAAFFRRNYGWDVGPDHIAITSGSQAAFFVLFNLFSGSYGANDHRKVLFPLAPEYIGYADQGLEADQFTSHRPRVVEEDGPFFKYYVDFSGLEVDGSVGALCAGRPTNPTGNVLTDAEVSHLAALARGAGVPFLLDNAYGAPFPGILFSDVQPYWDPNTILSLSLSKLGLPSVRTGIVVAPEPVVKALASTNAILNLTNPGLGQALVQPLVDDDSLGSLSREVIRPFYLAKRDHALAAAHRHLDGRVNWKVHRPEGSIFLWFWFPDLKAGSREAYRRLKDRGVLVVPGDGFFFGLPAEDDGWAHRRQCLRVNYARPEAEIDRGFAVLASVMEELGA